MIVVDTSVVVKWFAQEAGSDAALQLLRSREEFAAPDLLILEVANALMTKVRLSELLEVHAERSMLAVPDFIAVLYPTVDLIEEAWRLAFQLRHPVYDCVFLALALRLELRLVTADEKFLKKALPRFDGRVEALV
jgi:predicted nucleic acid-binding protein